MIVVVFVSLTEQLMPPFFVRLLAALVLVSFGVYKLARPLSHPKGFGMRVGPVGLAGWSFLMSSAHGAGLMLAPVLLGLPVYAAYLGILRKGWFNLDLAWSFVLIASGAITFFTAI